MKVLTHSLFQEVINNFETMKDKEGNKLDMFSLIISQGDCCFSHYFKKDIDLIDIRSISKAFLCVSLGIGIDEGISIDGEKLTLETKMWSFFKNKVNLSNEKNKANLEKIKLKHLLSHSMGFEKGLMFSKDIEHINPECFLDYIFNTNIVYEPGTKHIYSNVGPYLISVLIQNEFGINFSQWAYEKLLSKLEINNYEWKNYGKYCAGCTGLELSHKDLHKLGGLFMNDGMYKNSKIVSKNWLDSMRSIQILTPDKYDLSRVLPKYGYGLSMVICDNGIYYCDGSGGQYLIMNPHNTIVISILANQSDNKPITEALRPII